MEANGNKFIFNEPRLKMTYFGRLFARIIFAVSNAALMVGTFACLSSDSLGLKYTGGFLLLFWIDRVMHLRQGDAPLSELSKTGEVNLAKYLSPKTYRQMERAYERAGVKITDFYLEVAEMFLSLDAVKDGLSRLDIKPEELGQKLEGLLKESAGKEDNSARYEKFSGLVAIATNRALQSGHEFVSECDIFSSLASVKDPYLDRIFHMFTVTADDIESSILLSKMAKNGRKRFSIRSMIPELHRNIRHRVMNRAWTARPTPVLDRYSADFTDMARSGQIGYMTGHQKEYERVVDALSRSSNPNALLVGDPGIGTEQIVSFLAFNIIKDNVPKPLYDRRLVGLDITKMIAGAAPEEIQMRIQQIVKEIMDAENIILYLPEIHNLVRTSGNAFLSAADAFLPMIQNGYFPVIGATYSKEYKQDIDSRSDFKNLFEVINVLEITEAEAQRVVTFEGVILERKTGILVGFGAVKTAVSLAKKYMSGKKFLPGSAIEILRAGVDVAEKKGEKRLTVDDVMAAVESKTNIPIHEASGAEVEALLNFEEIVHKKFIDQEEAVKAVGNAIREYRSGLARKGGPIASFLFVGPTGVGKTELAKMVAEIQFGSRELMSRYDMTEYQDKKSFERFIGSADGAIRGTLTEKVLEKPYSLILLDEFEKAFPDILDLFLQVLDDGRLTDGLGRTVDFQNTVVIATSNAHSDIINSSLSGGKNMSDIAEYLKKKLTDVFKPELINRFSKIVIFKNLDPKDLLQIATLQLAELGKSLAEQGITLTFDESVAKYVVKLGYDPAFGARPLRRVIEEKLRSALAEKILRKEIEKGTEITVRAEGDQLVFK